MNQLALDYATLVAPLDAGPYPRPARLSAACLRVLARLQRGPADNVELSRIGGLRFGARLRELRQVGHEIKTEHLAGGVFLYTLENLTRGKAGGGKS